MEAAVDPEAIPAAVKPKAAGAAMIAAVAATAVVAPIAIAVVVPTMLKEKKGYYSKYNLIRKKTIFY